MPEMSEREKSNPAPKFSAQLESNTCRKIFGSQYVMPTWKWSDLNEPYLSKLSPYLPLGLGVARLPARPPAVIISVFILTIVELPPYR